jgi:dipeptidyl aminopeptidase/acylaminoacyl peptidase
MVRELGSREATPLFKTSSRVLYAPSGHLIYVRDGMLVAQPFDVATRETRGAPVAVGDELEVNNIAGAAFTISTNGVLAYRSRVRRGLRLLWIDRQGSQTQAIAGARGYTNTSLAPDGRRVAYDLVDLVGTDIWIRDLVRGVSSRFTFDPAAEFAPLWSPDGRTIVYSRAGESWDLYIKDVASTGDPRALVTGPGQRVATDWSRDGKYLIFDAVSAEAARDIWALPMTGDARAPIRLTHSRFAERGGVLSPDSKYLAYRSDESGTNQVYVQEFPVAHNKWQVSPAGGTDPMWRGDGRELFYRAPDLSVMAVPVHAGASFEADVATPLFRAPFAVVTARALYRPSPDGQRFLVLATPERDASPPTTVVLNWPALLTR